MDLASPGLQQEELFQVSERRTVFFSHTIQVQEGLKITTVQGLSAPYHQFQLPEVKNSTYLQFQQHKTTRGSSTPPWMGCQSIAGLGLLPSIKVTVDLQGCLPGKSFYVRCFRENLGKPCIKINVESENDNEFCHLCFGTQV